MHFIDEYITRRERSFRVRLLKILLISLFSSLFVMFCFSRVWVDVFPLHFNDVWEQTLC